MALLAQQRRDALLARLAADGSLHLEQAAAELGVSVMTVRRDLADLEASGLARRVRGGAVAPRAPQPFAERIATRIAAKSALARKARALLPADGAIALDASSTASVLIGMLEPRHELIVATNSVENAVAARAVVGTRVVLIGGELEERTGSFVGPFAERAAAGLSYRRFFGSAAALDPRGSTEVTPEEASMKRAFAAAADETVLLADSSKLDDRALARALDWTQVAVLVTELDPDDARLDAFRSVVDLI
jgi:DeoR family glycerol-3-phosphate regulon repressor